VTARGLHVHARALLDGELRRRRGMLGRLPGDGRASVEATAGAAVAAVVEALLAEARRDPRVADALAAIEPGTVRSVAVERAGGV
jgi:hypothetical protein